MTYEQAIEFFAAHGGFAKNLRGQAPTAGQLIVQVPTEKQLKMAANWAVQVEGQPRETADAAVQAVLTGWPSAFSGATS